MLGNELRATQSSKQVGLQITWNLKNCCLSCLLCCRFSSWFGNNSTTGKRRRLLGELHTRMAASGLCAADRTSVRTEYLPTLRDALTKPLIRLEKEGIPAVLDIMQVRLDSMSHTKLALCNCKQDPPLA